VTLATPLSKSKDSWLAGRLDRFGDTPCAYLLDTDDFDAACTRFGPNPSAAWFSRRVAWFDPTRLNGVRLGLIE
jgi:hypothetical protein